MTQPDLLQILFFAELNPASAACNYVALPFRESVLVLSGLLLVTEGGKKWQYTGEKASTQGCPTGPVLVRTSQRRSLGRWRWRESPRIGGKGRREAEGILGDAQGFIGKGQELAGNVSLPQ